MLGVCSKTTIVLVAIAAVGVYLCFHNDTLLGHLDHVLDQLQEHEEHLAKHIYLHGNYAPVAEEHIAVPGRVVEGALPENLTGLFVRNGPNPVPDHIGQKRYHWFDGHGHLHNLRLLGGNKALYSNQYIPTPRYLVEKEKNREYFLRIGELTGLVGLFKALVMEPKRLALNGMTPLAKGQANTHSIMSPEHKFYAVHEASLPFELQLKDDGSIAKAVGYETFQNVLDYPVSAHPKVDPLNGRFLFHSYSADPTLLKEAGSYKVGEYDPTTKQVVSYYGVRTADNHTSFAHDLMFTKNWFVLYDSSTHFDRTQILTKNGRIFNWKPEASLKFGLAPRHTPNATSDDVIWFDVGTPHMMIHPLNAWEDEDGTVVMWSPCGDYFDLNMDQGANTYYMAEFRMNPGTGQVTKAVVDDTWNVEFPRIREDYLGRFGRYGTATIMDPALGGDGLFKGFVIYDMLEKNTHATVLYREGDVGGEAVVIPKPGTTESHEFYIGTFIHNTKKDKSFFVLYDGETTDLVARVEMPHRVPHGFHCQWLDEAQLQGHLQYHGALTSGGRTSQTTSQV